MEKMIQILKRMLLIILGLIGALFLGVYFITYHPQEVEKVKFSCNNKIKPFPKDGKIKVLSWNVQYMAGKNYIFYYDVPNGPDTRPSSEDIALTLDQVAKVIQKEDPDIVLLQEMDEGSKRTDFHDQTTLLNEKLNYPCRTDAFYHKAKFVPHAQIMGAVGLKLSTLSRFKIISAVRYQLPLMPNDIITQQFYLKRAVLKVNFEGTDFVALNTHFDAFAQGSDTMKRQVDKSIEILESIQGNPWVLGGDFNLLPPGGKQRQDLSEHRRDNYLETTELKALTDKFAVFPSIEQANGSSRSKFYTHFPNDKKISAPDRTIDYVFYEKVKMLRGEVLQGETLKISDHLPIVMEFEINR